MRLGCPAHVDIPGYISLVEAGRYADAVKVIRKNNPLPLVCGRCASIPVRCTAVAAWSTIP